MRYYRIGGGKIIEDDNYYDDRSNGFTNLTGLASKLNPKRYYFNEINYVCVNIIISIIIVVLDLAESCASGNYKKRFNIVNYVNKRQIGINYRYKKRYMVILKFE